MSQEQVKVTRAQDIVRASIIVPVYNMEKYLRRCIDGLLTQTYKNIEIILVDDQSTDLSLQICEEYARRDPRVRVLCQDNKGVSAARNMGLNYCTGDYIYFVDPDDYVAPQLIEDTLNAMMNHDADMVAFGTQIVNGNKKGGVMAFDEHMTSEEIIQVVSFVFGWELWKKAYKKEVWDNVRINPIMRNCGDAYIMADVMKHVHKAVVLAGGGYIIFGNVSLMAAWCRREKHIAITLNIWHGITMKKWDMSLYSIKSYARYVSV